MPPQVNAELTRVTGSTAGESFDGPGPLGPVKWDGSEGVYFRTRRDRQREQAGGDVILDRLLIVDATVPIDWRIGDGVEFTKDGQGDTGTVRQVQRATIDDPDIPPELQTVRITLDPA